MGSSVDQPRCLVLGGSGALGREVCSTLAGRGCRVAFSYESGEEAARRIESEVPRSRAFRLDLRRLPEDDPIGPARDWLDGLDALVQCAGVGDAAATGDAASFRKLGEVTAEEWDHLLGVNLRGTFFACARAAGMMEESGGSIVLIGSIDGVKPVPAPVHYAASKGALGAMARAMAKELGPSGIRVNVVAPGIMEDGLSRTLPPKLRADYLDHDASGRLGKLSEIAAVVAWLAVENTYVTGQTIVVDGGL